MHIVQNNPIPINYQTEQFKFTVGVIAKLTKLTDGYFQKKQSSSYL
jgi:hypothetical protein